MVVDGSTKFREAAVEDSTVTVRYGRIGSEGRTQVKALVSADAAQQYPTKAIAEKEREGYREVTAEAGPVAAAEESQGSRAEDGPVVFPDEETFEMPAGWRRLVYPRRGGIRRSFGELHAEAEELVERRVNDPG